ncbi:MAG: hypothetical protein ACOCTI_04885 [Phycisphaeraceae bacterium]
MTQSPSQGERGPLPALLWACFLGSSWTWVIGMLLPALLLRDFGLGGWLVFAIPNVVGAAAMGFVLGSPVASSRLVERHRPAALLFSEITIAYHVFAVGWAFYRLFGAPALLAAAAVALVVVGIAQRRRMALVAATGVTLVSLALLASWLARGFAGWPGLEPGRLTTLDLLLFAPASVAGFALCPYLDLTFHRARQATSPRTGRIAFAAGFGGVFLAMIVFSLVYGSYLVQLILEPGNDQRLGSAPALLLGIHLVIQAGLTVGLHLREVAEHGGQPGLLRTAGLGLAAAGLAWWAASDPTRLLHELVAGEVIYRGFLLFYGLVFPAYVFLVIWPTRRPRRPMVQTLGWLCATLAAAPMSYAGFVLGYSGWIPASLVVLVAARVAMEVLPLRSVPATHAGPGA